MGEKKNWKQISFIFVVFRKCTQGCVCWFCANVWSPNSSRIFSESIWMGTLRRGGILFFLPCWEVNIIHVDEPKCHEYLHKIQKTQEHSTAHQFPRCFFVKTALSILASLSLFISMGVFILIFFEGTFPLQTIHDFWVSRKHGSVEKKTNTEVPGISTQDPRGALPGALRIFAFLFFLLKQPEVHLHSWSIFLPAILVYQSIPSHKQTCSPPKSGWLEY